MATTTKDDDAAAAGVATPVKDYDQYKAAVEEQARDARFGVTADATDVTRGWTVQSSYSVEEPAQQPGQRFLPEQLPDPKVAARAGFAPVQVPEHLIVRDDDDPQGPEPWEIGKDPREVAAAVRDRAVADFTANAKANADAKESATSTRKAPLDAKVAPKSS